MRKFIFTAVMLLMALLMQAESRTYVVRVEQQPYRVQRTETVRVVEREREPESEYILDRKIKESKDNAHPFVGIATRFGYSYNDDAFMYGASLYYHGGNILGITTGFDGYYASKLGMPFPMWDIRVGLMISKYFACGPLFGKCNMDGCKSGEGHNPSKNLWGNKTREGIFGGYAAFILPISKHIGVNMDFALTNHTGFSVCAGVNVTLPIK